jgi:hypothetical protein
MLAISAGLEAKLARELSQRLGEWPLALELAASMIRERVRQSELPGDAAQRLEKIVERKGVTTLRYATTDSRHNTISSVLGISLDLLDAASRRRLIELSIFPEDVRIARHRRLGARFRLEVFFNAGADFFACDLMQCSKDSLGGFAIERCQGVHEMKLLGARTIAVST